ncbi:OB-fold protein [Winogradskyella sp. A2]|uniref:OB-fold protein n=1 Tax=Winogradskyella sp. A2 TaxID=3366944 RepID=UPI00398C33BF
MKKKIGILLAIILFTIIATALVYDYAFNSAHRNIAEEQASASVTANELLSQFQKDEALSTTTYLDKVIEITGKITAVETNSIVLNDQVQVDFMQNTILNVRLDSSIKIKGRCVGYDELLEMVKIDQATIQ